MSVKCFHHNDLDGICSAAIVRSHYSEDKCFFVSVDYKSPFPLDTVTKNDLVIIVDFSLENTKDFDKLLKVTNNNVIWIDHHKTAIDKYKDYDTKGIRKDGTAACVLTWKYFYPNIKVPQIVEMLGDFDVWDFSKYGKDLDKLQCGITLYNTDPESSNWNKWLEDKTLSLLLEEGEIALKYRTNFYRELISSYSFSTKFEGYDAICCNAGLNGSQIFDSIKDSYDIMLTFIFDGEKFNISLYTKKDNIDVSEIAKKYGGGGHKKASGFSIKNIAKILK